MRGRNRNNKGPNPLTKSYESNGPDVKIRGTAQHIAEKYSQLARDAQASGDPVAAENYFQHAEHYYRIIAAAQEQLREQFGYQQRFEDEGEDDGFTPSDRPGFGNGEDPDPASQPQPYEARGDGERPSRFERGEQRQDRQDHRQDYRQDQHRQDRRDRFQRDRGPRQDAQHFQRGGDEQPYERSERPNRGDFRRDRRRDAAEAPDAGGLPAFLTNPARAPAPPNGNGQEQPSFLAAQDGPEDDNRPRRRRRTRRDVIEGAGDEGPAFPTDGVESPAAE